MAVFQHPDMPKAIAGVPGLNHWNFLFINTFFSWLLHRKQQNFTWDMPKNLNFLLFLYGLIIFISLVRYLSDHSGVDELMQVYGLEADTGLSALNEYLFNCFKWVLPAMIIFDGCRNRKQYDFAVIALALMFILLALQVIKAMKFGSLTMSGESLQRRALKVISRSVGYHRVNMSMMMSGAFWLVFCLKEYVSNRRFFLFILPACLVILIAMAMTGGRTGYATWAVLGAMYCIFKWRRYLFLVPVMFFAVLIYAPSTVERFMYGVVEQDTSYESQVNHINFDEGNANLHAVTSGRVVAWPLVWESISEAPWLGYGREAMKNQGITLQIMLEHGEGESFPHPHNAYLQWLQDNGLIGAIPVFWFYLLLVRYSWSLFRDGSHKIYVVTGGMSLALILAFLIASIGSQTFYPREGAVGMWVAIALMLRVYIERKAVRLGEKSLLVSVSEK
ncbi:O-antigen ligase family protein [Psychromonas sp. MME2]|uniref:O-antigen ligase family protein n=1 Tax=Psychromonas sp. MME2 TaxID=3231033 RepID=UPI00339D12E7